MTYFDIKLLIVTLALLELLFLCVRYRKKALTPLTLAFVVAALWSAYFRYEYTEANVFLFNRINIYPLVLWTAGLTTLQLASYKLPGRYRLISTIALYFIFLLAAEFVGYRLLGIRLASEYSSLLNLGVIHAPLIMKVFYILAGPAYLLLFDVIIRSRRRN